MPAYKDAQKGTWYAAFYYQDWKGVKKKKLKRGFPTKKEALAWERTFLLQQAADLTMTFEAFVEIYIVDKQNRLRENTWSTKEHAINDKNVLPFRVDYIKTMEVEADIDDKQVWDIDREKAFMAPKRIALVTKYILEHFDQKTYRGDKSYEFNLLTNVAEVASAKRGAVEEIKQKQRVSGFNSIFCVASVPMAMMYYDCKFGGKISVDRTENRRGAAPKRFYYVVWCIAAYAQFAILL